MVRSTSIVYVGLAFGALVVPKVAYAVPTLFGLAITFYLIFNLVVALIFGLALVIFLIGLVRYLANADNEERRREGKKFILWGIVALFVMVAVWGLVQVLTFTFGTSKPGIDIQTPCLGPGC